jgi:general secretion pathway protein D
MKKSAYIRFALSFLLVISMFSPIAVLAMGDGKKHFKEGMKAEVSEDWDKAAEEFALAITENPKNAEYRLHYVRALFNASQMYIRKGNSLAKEKDFKGAYDAFRKAYAYDPTNELAKAEMERMARLYKETLDGKDPDPNASKNDLKLVQTSYGKPNLPQGVVIPQKLEELGSVGPFPGGVDMQTLIRDLARSLDLNVIFDAETFRSPQKINIELKGVTTAKALDYIFLQQNLFFQKVGPRTILVANNNARQKFQQLVLRTFYLANANPKDVIDLIGRVIPAQPGRTPTIAIKDDATNSITIRDTAENIELMGQLIKSLDKDRAEVVMDVAIYEVSKSDLLKIGNQIGNESQLTNLGGTTRSVVDVRKDRSGSIGRIIANEVLPQVFGVGFAIPAANLVAFQNKQNTKLLASTQIHAFNNEDSSARIGQRVPVTTASFNTGITNPGTGGNGVVSNVINYEQVGLTLKFKPIVFPNQDVQVAMEIESKDVVACNSESGNPCFSERTIKGTARVQNNKTLMLASVAQDTQSDGRQGLPLLGLIPILGRLFTAPTKDNRQVDIIIAVTPRVIRAPSILPEDEVERPTGSLAQPTNGSLEAMVIQEEIDEQLANARRLGNNTAVQLPDRKTEAVPTYVRTDAKETSLNTETKPETTQPSVTPNETVAANIRPIDSSNVKTLQVTPTSDNSSNTSETILPKPMQTLTLQETSLKSETPAVKTETTPVNINAPKAEVRFLPNLPEMKAGEKTKIAVMVKSGTAFRSAVLGLKFDDKKLAIRAVSFGDVFGGDLAGKDQKPYLNQNGKTYVSLSSSKNTAENTSGILAYIEVEALTDGKHEIAFDADLMNILTADGKDFMVKF